MTPRVADRLTTFAGAIATACVTLLFSPGIASGAGVAIATPVIRTGPMTINVVPTSVNPTANIPPNPAYPGVCQTTPTSASCQNSAISALNNARAAIGLGSYQLPINFQTLAPTAQLLVLSNLDRQSYGLTQILGLNTTLNAAAAAGISADSDPIGPTTVDGNGFSAWASNWAVGWASPLYTYYEWMYDDGYSPGSSNIDCPSASAPGCWGHRSNTLSNFGSGKVLMGAASGTSPHYNAPAFTELYESFAANASVTYVGGPVIGSALSCLGSSLGGPSPAALLTRSVSVGQPSVARMADLLAVDAAGGLWMYRNSGVLTAPFVARTAAASGAFPAYLALAAGDVTGDGRADVVASASNGTLWFYVGNGGVNPYTSGAVQIGLVGWDAFNWIGLADVDGDRRADLLATTPDGRMFYYPNTGSSTPFQSAIQIGSGWQNFVDVSVGDVNGDGRADLIATSSDGKLWLFLNSGSTSAPFPTTGSVISASGWQNFDRVALADVNGDGYADIVSTSPDGRLWYYQNNHTSTPYGTGVVIGASGWNNYPSPLLFANVHGIGSADVVATSPDGRLWYYQNNGTATPYTGVSGAAFNGWQNFTQIAMGDINGDGLPDLLATDGTGRLWYYPNTNSCTPFSQPVIIGAAGWNNFTTISVGDVNGDGEADIVATSPDGLLWYYQNNGTGTHFGVPTIIGAGGWQNFNHIVLADVNGDGKADIVATSPDGRLWYYQNNGTGIPFGVPTIIGAGGWNNFNRII